MSQLISAVIITFNEEEHIAKCIESVQPIVAEVIVIDALSTDDTVRIATDAGANVVSRKWKGYGSAKNHGSSIAANNWILSIDADERVGEELRQSILQEPLNNSIDYALRRTNIYKSKMMKFGALHPQWKTRLYNRSFSSWDSRRVHEQLISKTDRKSKRLVGGLVHHAYASEEDYSRKLQNYALLTAEQWKKSNFQPSVIAAHLGPMYHFFRTYIVQLGILEGHSGWQTSRGAYQYSKEKYRAFKSLNKKEKSMV